MQRFLSLILRASIVVMPWGLKRRFLRRVFGYEIHPTARIGYSWFFPGHLVMEEGARVDHLTLCHGVEEVRLGPHSIISNLNWITGEPYETRPGLYAGYPDRRPELILGEHSGIVKRHYVDCTDSVTIERYAVLGGIRTTLLSHAYDIDTGSVRAAPVVIREYCLVSGNCTILPGSSLPPYSILGAASLLNKVHEQSHRLYGGVPAREIKELSGESGLFTRTVGELT
jgi:acetyltransferase-like isoleucine patch superfamily enzyme